MLTTELLAFVRSSLPEPPARVLEIGAGRGELASELRAAGYTVKAIDPGAEPGSGVQRRSLLTAAGAFDAAVAILSLHHIDPLEESFAHLATLLVPQGLLVIDEFDVDRYDERAVRWWLAQRRTLGFQHEDADPSRMARDLREHVHSLATVWTALRSHFEIGEPIRGPHLHRRELRPSLREAEVDLIAEGLLPATGARSVALRKS